ncbi:MAG: hypothetical protein ACI4J6_10510 [Oscillospiraceae bacterium]
MANVKNDKAASVKAEDAVKEVKAPEVAAEAPKADVKKAEAPKAEKPAAPKAEEKKPAAKKPAKTAPAEKKTAEKTAAKKPAAKKPAEKKTTGRKAAAKAATYDSVVAEAKKKFAAAKTAKIKYPIAANFELAPNEIFYVYIGEAGVAVEPYKYDDYDIYFRTDAETLTKVLTGKKGIIDALADSSVKLDGNTKKAVLFIDAAF